MIACPKERPSYYKKNAENERKRSVALAFFKLYLTHDYAFDLLIRGVLGWFPLLRNFYLSVHAHVNFTLVNQKEARYEVSRLNVKLSDVRILRFRATFQTLHLFYLRTKLLRTYAPKNYAAAEIHPYWISAKKRFNLNLFNFKSVD